MADVQDVASMIVNRYGTIDTFKLQKLLYYSQAWHLVWRDKPLFDEPIEAWAAGPVVRSVYNHHRGNYAVDSWEWGDGDKLRKKERRTVEAVIDSYGRMSGRQLSHLTHSERPWQAARSGLGPTDRSERPIGLADMRAFYSALDADDDAPRVVDIIEPVDDEDG